MRTTKQTLLILIFMTFAILNAKSQSYETTSKWGKATEPTVAIEVNAPDDIAIQSFYDLLKSEKLKGKKSKTTVSFVKTTFPNITSDYINLYASIVPKDNNNSTLCVFVNKGVNSNFISSSTDKTLIDNLKSYLDNRYAPFAAKANLENKINIQQKIIDDTSKELDKNRKNLEKKTKQRDQLLIDIEALNKQIQSQDSLLVQHRENLEKIKKEN